MMHNKKYFLSVVITNLFFAFWYITKTQYANLAFLAYITYSFATNDEYGDFYMLAGMLPFLKLIKLGGVSIVFVYQMLIIAKLCIKNRNLYMSYTSFAGFFIIVFVEFVFDYPVQTIGEFIYTICNICFYFIYSNNIRVQNIDVKLLLRIIIFSTGMCMILIAIVSFLNGMSLMDYAKSNEEYVRFGSESDDLIGAMAIPTYVGTVLSCVYVLFVKYKVSVVEMVIYALLSAYVLFIGLLSVSRGLILCIGVLVLCIIINYCTTHERKNLTIILAVCTVIAIAFVNNTTLFDNMLVKLQTRANNETLGENSRTAIWRDCLDYLIKNPISILIGNGVNNYKLIGKSSSMLFSMSAHNLVLDAIMSWGITGLLAISATAVQLRDRLTRYSEFVYYTPMLVWGALRMIGGAFTQFSVFVSIVVFIVISSGGKHMDLVGENNHE